MIPNINRTVKTGPGTGRLSQGATGAGPSSGRGVIERLHADLAVAGDDPFVGGEVGGAHGAAGVELVGADADLGAETVFPAVGETGGGVDDHAGGVDAVCELVDVV